VRCVSRAPRPVGGGNVRTLRLIGLALILDEGVPDVDEVQELRPGMVRTRGGLIGGQAKTAALRSRHWRMIEIGLGKV